MLTYLENLRKRPEAERRKAVLRISISITVGILLVWGVYMTIRIENSDLSFAPDPTTAGVPSLKDSFSNFADAISRAFNGSSTVSQ